MDRIRFLFQAIAVIVRETGCPVTWGNCNADTTSLEVYVGKLVTLKLTWRKRYGEEQWCVDGMDTNVDAAYLTAHFPN